MDALSIAGDRPSVPRPLNAHQRRREMLAFKHSKRHEARNFLARYPDLATWVCHLSHPPHQAFPSSQHLSCSDWYDPTFHQGLRARQCPNSRHGCSRCGVHDGSLRGGHRTWPWGRSSGKHGLLLAANEGGGREGITWRGILFIQPGIGRSTGD